MNILFQTLEKVMIQTELKKTTPIIKISIAPS
eukprot:CAMPEP_0206266258 /NCGR_PEP_ID=MMETSP0047_2-20121206/30468_1 /ASSEMBLY_ACC=CAM_ASM_000192 /TAXON_ID=195065 /ORGANISM="Chroomonas mesostigmatica_cf, Strain CCMP1168" /LENGTH=31 /DNA_ID= /DNA_START= /DNA_END= /DNA_ORIENTATION=